MIFLHNLLHICGNDAVKQPLISGESGIVLLYNGEIYNYNKDLHSDTYSIIPAYLAHGEKSFIRQFDGEFALLLYDQDARKIIYSTDVFMTKPLHVAKNGNGDLLGVATYASSLSSLKDDGAIISMANPNEVVSYDLNKKVYTTYAIKQWNLNQVDESWSHWEVAFENAVRKRIPNVPYFVCLSSGYDSGAICLALNRLGQQGKYATISSFKGENEAILKKRISLNNTISYVVDSSSSSSYTSSSFAKKWNEIEPLTFLHQDYPGQIAPLQLNQDGGAQGMNRLAGQMRAQGYLVSLSGSGADEIISDYGFAGEKWYAHSEFGGLFPEDLKSIFPWKKFYHDTQRSYLFKDEMVCGAHGVEGRYPFLDVELVQKFLNTSAAIKNEAYKAPILSYLKKYNYPFDEGVKKGFTAP
jgi:asparagine synthetase B (glutamine-hydrolysing)